MLELLAEVLTGADVPGRRGRHRAGPAGRPDPGGAEPARAPGPGGAAQADVRPPPVRGADPGAGAGPRGRARRSCARCTPSGCTRPARCWCWSATSSRSGRWTPPSGRSASWSGAGPDGRAAAGAAAGARAAAAGRPARLGAVVAADRAAGGAAHPPGPRRAAAGQPGLRRLLLLPLGGEHPRGQGLHLRPALADRALRRRLGAGRRRRGGHRGHRPGAAGDARTSWAGWPACRRSEDELEQARQYALGTLQLGMSTQAGLAGAGQHVRRLRAAAGLPGRARGAGWPRRPASDVAAGGGALPRAGAGGRPWCSATRRGSRRRWPR